MPEDKPQDSVEKEKEDKSSFIDKIPDWFRDLDITSFKKLEASYFSTPGIPLIHSENRDRLITVLLGAFVNEYRDKNKRKHFLQVILCIITLSIVVFFSIQLFCLLKNPIWMKDEIIATSVVAFVTACITYLTIIVGVLTIITKYCFPENEEEHITRIVETIQTNDMKHVIADIRHNEFVVSHQKELTIEDVADKSDATRDGLK